MLVLVTACEECVPAGVEQKMKGLLGRHVCMLCSQEKDAVSLGTYDVKELADAGIEIPFAIYLPAQPEHTK